MEAELEKVVPAEIQQLPALLDGLKGFLEKEDLRREEITGIQIAVDEAFSNIVLHGYKGGGGSVTLRCRVSPGEAEVVLEDRAPRFDPTILPPPDRDSDLAHRRPGGVGFYLIRHFVDGVSYEYRDGRNILTLRKRLGGG